MRWRDTDCGGACQCGRERGGVPPEGRRAGGVCGVGGVRRGVLVGGEGGSADVKAGAPLMRGGGDVLSEGMCAGDRESAS